MRHTPSSATLLCLLIYLAEFLSEKLRNISFDHRHKNAGDRKRYNPRDQSAGKAHPCDTERILEKWGDPVSGDRNMDEINTHSTPPEPGKKSVNFTFFTKKYYLRLLSVNE